MGGSLSWPGGGGQPEPRVVTQIYASGSLGGTFLHARSPAPAVTCGAPPLAAGHRLGLECNAWRLKPLETTLTTAAVAASAIATSPFTATAVAAAPFATAVSAAAVSAATLATTTVSATAASTAPAVATLGEPVDRFLRALAAEPQSAALVYE